MRVLGVDPGLTGALAVVKAGEGAGALVSWSDMPTTNKGKELDVEALHYLVVAARDRGARVMVIERQQAAPGQGVGSTFKLGMQYGLILGLARAAGMRIVEVAPALWKSGMRLGSDKAQSRQAAMKAWPNDAKLFARVKDHGRAEAALIALWGVRSGAAKEGLAAA